jgi:phage terminase large subunit-like protein
VKLACERHVRDLATGHERGLYFDEEAADKALRFIENLRHIKGKWASERRKITLEGWQKFIVSSVFGWKKESGIRRFRYAYVEVPRKNGKTALAAGIANYMLIADGEAGAEVYTAATTRDQARECFDAARAMMVKLSTDSAKVKEIVGIHQHNVHVLSTNSKMEPVSSDADTLDGSNPHLAIIDEYHAHKTDEVYNVMKSGMGAREQPLQFTITTAGFNKNGPCYALRKSCIELLEGKKTDDGTFCIVYTLDPGDDWKDPAVWAKANPNFNVSVYPDYIKGECTQAQNMPSQQVNFLTKNLNVWTDASDVWIADDQWTQNQTPVSLEDLTGRKCYAGLDLASISDICSLCLLFPSDDNERFDVLWRRWIPELSAERRSSKDGVAYMQWVAEGYMTTTGGNVTDYNWIKHEIMQIAEQVQLVSIAYDRFNSSQLVNDLTEEGITMAPFGQGFISMNAPTKQLEKFALEGKLNHGNDPVARWMMGNVEIKRDPAGNIKIDKGKSSEKVDDMVALAMAIGEWMTLKEEEKEAYIWTL